MVRDDLDVLLSCRPKEIRVVTENYRYVLKADPDPGYTTTRGRLKAIRQRWQQQYNQIRRARRKKLSTRYGDPLPPEIEVDFWERVSEDAPGVVGNRQEVPACLPKADANMRRQIRLCSGRDLAHTPNPICWQCKHERADSKCSLPTGNPF